MRRSAGRRRSGPFPAARAAPRRPAPRQPAVHRGSTGESPSREMLSPFGGAVSRRAATCASHDERNDNGRLVRAAWSVLARSVGRPQVDACTKGGRLRGMRGLLVAIAALSHLLVVADAQAPTEKGRRGLSLAEIAKPWTGDLDGMQERRMIRV